MSLYLLIGLGVLALAALVLLSVGLLGSQDTVSVEDRLQEFATLEQPPTLEEIELSQPFAQRVVIPILEGLAGVAQRFTPQEQIEGIQHKTQAICSCWQRYFSGSIHISDLVAIHQKALISLRKLMQLNPT